MFLQELTRASGKNVAIQKILFGFGTTTLILWNGKMDDTMEIDRSRKESGLLIKRVSKITKNKAKNKNLYVCMYECMYVYPVYRLLSLKQGLDVLVALFTTLLQVTLSNALSLFKLHEFKSSIMTSSQDLRGRPLPRFPLTSRLWHWLIQPSERLTYPNHLKHLDLRYISC